MAFGLGRMVGLLVWAGVTAAAAPVLQLSEVAAVVHANGVRQGQYGVGDVEYWSALDAESLGQFGFSFLNGSGGVFSNTRVTFFLDAEIDPLENGYSNEWGEFLGLGLPAGAVVGAIAADGWEIDEPSYVFGDIYGHVLDGLLENANGVPETAPFDVSLALTFLIGDVPDGGEFSVVLELARGIGALVQHDDASGAAFGLNGYGLSSGSGSGGPPPPPVGDVPEPATVALLGVGLVILGCLRGRRRSLSGPAAALAVVLGGGTAAQAQPVAKFTTTADFLRGTLVNLSTGTPGALQVNPPTGTQTFPFLNVAASARGTVVRIHTSSGQVVGEYATAPEGFPSNPSRTTVDLEGNVWVGLRDATYLGKGAAVKIGLVVGGTRVNASGEPDSEGAYLKPPFLHNTCVDRSRDGLIKTSRKLGDVLRWVNVTDGEGGVTAEVEEAEDECILLYQTTPGTNTRHVTIDRENNVWVAGYPYAVTEFAKLDGRTGRVLDGFDARAFGCGGYGGVVDRNGILWSSSSIEGRLLRYDPVTRAGTCLEIPYAYGLAIAPDGDIWTASYGTNTMYRVSPAGVIRSAYPVSVSPNGPTGTAVTPANGHVWVANRFSANVSHLDADGRQLKVIEVGLTPTGVAVDAAGKVWVSNFDSSSVMRIDPAGGADGLGVVELTIDLIPPAGTAMEGRWAGPYNYSDMTGVIAIGSTSPQGSFQITQDGGEAGTVWSLAEFNTEPGAAAPAGTVVKVELRASDAPASFPAWVEVQSGVRFQLTGRYLEARVTLKANGSGQSPVFTNLNLYGERRVEDLLTRAKDAAADLQWTPIPQATAYNVYRRLGGGAWGRIRQGFVPAAGAAAIYPDTGLENGKTYYYMVRWVDRAGNESPDSIVESATGTARTSRGLTTPTITSAPVVRAMQSTVYAYAVKASDPDAGDKLVYLLAQAPAGMRIDAASGVIGWTPAVGQTGAQRVEVRVQDLGGRFASQAFDVMTASARVNYNPVFRTAAPASIPAGQKLRYDADATDENDGEILTYSLDLGPAGLTVRASDGLVEWTPSAAQVGSHPVVLRAVDGFGGFALQSFTLQVTANRPPAFTSSPVTSGGTGLRYQYRATAADPDGGLLTFEVASAPSGFQIGPQTGIAEWVPQSGQVGTFPVTLRVRDAAGAVGTQTYSVRVVVANLPPVFTSTPVTTASATVAWTYTARATDPEATAVKYGLTAYPYNMKIDAASGVISFTPTVAQLGVHNVVVRATDANGLQTFQTFALTVGAADTVLPLVSLTSPANGARISSDIELRGSVTDANLRQWRVEFRPAGSSVWSTLSSGSLPVVNGVLGRLPATLLANDAYRLRLYAEDMGGAVSTPEIEVTVDSGQLKLGAMTLAFDDVVVANAPLAIALRRLYDSRQPAPGDFGPGWKLGLSGVDLRLDSSLNAFVTLPDGRRTAFAFSAVSSGFVGSYPKYTGAPGVTDTLEPVDCPLIFPAGGTFVCAFQPDYRPNAWKLTTRAGLVYEFDRDGKFTRISDRNGRQMTFTATGITTNYGRSVTIARDGAGKITSITDALGHLHRYQYDGQGRLSSYQNAQNEVSTFSYPAAGHLLTSLQTPGNCNPLRVTYDTDGRVASKIDAANRTVRFSYNVAQRTETQTDDGGLTTTRRYDAAGNLLEVTDPLGLRTLYAYDANNMNTSIVEPSGRTVSRVFDARGNLVSQTVPGQGGPQTTTFAYNALDQIAEIRNPLGDRTVYTYDGQGRRLSKEKRDSGGVTLSAERWTYNAAGDAVSYTDGDGRTTAYTRNSAGELTARTDPTGRVTRYSYDVNGNLVGQTTPDGETLVLGYDGFNRLARLTRNGVVLRNVVRNEEGQVLSETDALGRVTRYQYSCQASLSGVTDALGRQTTAAYNAYGNLLSFTDPAGRQTAYQYDAGQRPLRRTDPAGQATAFVFNSDGLESLRTDPLGQATATSYDGTLSATRVTRPEGAILYGYDGNGRLQRVDDNRNSASKVTQIGYDGIGRVSMLTHPGGRVVRYGYNGRGQKTAVTAPDGSVVGYEYDAAGRLSRVTLGAAQVTYSYDAGGRMTEAAAANGVRSAYSYDAAGRMLTMTVRDAASSGLASYVLSRNAAGLVTARTDGSGTAAYSYDALNRLTGDGSSTWSFDAGGNRSGGTYSADHRLTHDGTRAYTYDNAGRVTQRGTERFTWDSQNLLVGYSGPSGTGSYGYDFLGRRVSRVSGGVTTEYVYDGANLLAEYRNGGLWGVYAYGPGLDRPVLAVLGGVTYYYHLDPGGNVVLMTDAAGAVAQRYQYATFGTLTSSTGSVSNALMYQGREYDNESGLYNFRARVYDPTIGRFLTKDPLLGEMRDPRSMQPYVYAFHDPVNAKDATGESALIEYAGLITAPNIQEQTGALIGFLQGFAIPQLRFLGEFLGLDSSYDVGTRWDLAVSNTEAYLEQIQELIGYTDYLKDTPGFVGAWAGGASFQFGKELSQDLGPLTYSYDGFTYSVSFGGFEEGGKSAIRYLRGLRPY